ncbi:MAG: hypothetical protein ACI9AT_000438 [Ulvibacter sp.]|jgi:hypothetical protein
MKNQLEQAIETFLKTRSLDGVVINCTTDELKKFVEAISVQSYVSGTGVKIFVDGIWGAHTESEFIKSDIKN